MKKEQRGGERTEALCSLCLETGQSTNGVVWEGGDVGGVGVW